MNGGNVDYNNAPVPAIPSAPISVLNSQTIRISAAGFYEVLYHILVFQEGRQFELRINGSPVPGGKFSNLTSGATVDGKLIMQVSAAQLPADITLVNVSGGNTDYFPASPTDVSAMISIIKLA